MLRHGADHLVLPPPLPPRAQLQFDLLKYAIHTIATFHYCFDTADPTKIDKPNLEVSLL